MHIHQFVHTLSYGDAISSEALALREVFRAAGHESEVYAINIHPKYRKSALDYRDFPAGFEGEVILHYSLGSPLNHIYTGLNRAKRSLIYHNLTPAHWFAGVNPRIVSDITRGLEELPHLCSLSDRLIADSSFNESELAGLGFESALLQLPVDPARWDAERNPGIYNLLKKKGGINVLHVGRLAPNKCVEDIIKTFYFLHYHITKESRLWLVGIDIDTELYSFSLKRLVDELHLRDVVSFAGRLSDEEVRAMYEGSSAYLCMSEHEGFCLPVVEAMHFGLPVIAYASSALPETIGDGGILVNEKRHPELAELVYDVSTDAGLRRSLAERGSRRVERLSHSFFETRVRELFAL